MLGQSSFLSERPVVSGRCSSSLCPLQPFTLRKRPAPRLSQLVRAQTENSSNGEQDKRVSGNSQNQSKDKSNAGRGQRNRKGKGKSKQEEDASLNADDFNPIALGRRSRQLLNDVWRQFTNISSPVTSTVNLDPAYSRDVSEVGEYEAPEASNTTILVVGGTGRVGRVLVRKLVLRGYNVRVLVRNKEQVLGILPSSVGIMEGDVGSPETLRAVVEGTDKIIYCARATASTLGDAKVVEETGPARLAQELQNARHRLAAKATPGQTAHTAKLKLLDPKKSDEDWAIEGKHEKQQEEDDSWAAQLAKSRRSRFAKTERDELFMEKNTRNNIVFKGKLFSAGTSAAVGVDLNVEEHLMAGREGIIVRALGDGQQYVVQLTQDTGEVFTTPISTALRFINFRLPFTSFRYSTGGQGPSRLDPSRLTRLSIRYDNKAAKLPSVVKPGDLGLMFSDSSAKDFSIEIDRVKAMPTGEETDFILVSCAGALVADDEPVSAAAVLSHKRKGEQALRHCGLGYTIIRPGPLLEEPGGYKALVFDQGERITQGISYADVADVCLKALHDRAARNKTFEVCQEYTPEEGLEQYELVAHVPNKSNNYLAAALSVLEKNT